MDQAKSSNFELLERQASENSTEMSISSLSLNMTSDDSSLEPSNSPDGIGIEFPMYPNYRNNISPKMSTMEKNRQIEMAINKPDFVVWSKPTKTVFIKKGENGSLGFNFKGRDVNSMYYLLVVKVTINSPAYGKLESGDLILSVNGHPMDCTENVKEFPNVVKNSGTELKFITQSPKKLLLSKKRHGNDKYDIRMKPEKPLLVNRVKCQEDLMNIHMHSLPFLKLFILGKESSSLTLSLIGATSKSDLRTTNDVAAYGHVDVKECNQRYEWLKVKHSINYYSDVIKSRRKFMLNKKLNYVGSDLKFQQNVRLEVVSIEEGRISDSCYQLLLCKHAIYAIQFSVQQFTSDPELVLQTIQNHLCKIRCYASTSVRVFLIGTQNCTLSCNVCDIGKTLHNRFSATYGKMLQYDPATNVPCFIVTIALDNQRKLITHQHLVQSDTCSGIRFEPQLQGHNQLRLSEQVQLYNVQKVMNDISKVAIGQGFIETSYPYQYLQLHKQVDDLRGKRLKCVQRDLFSCSSESHSELTYLHDSGDIINAGNLVYPFSTSETPNYLIMIDRQHLLMAACTISNVVPEAQCDPNNYHAWRDLKISACAEKSFLATLTGGKHEVDFLELMSVIHCLQRREFLGVHSMNNAPEEVYLVPVHLYESSPYQDIYERRMFHQQLCVDFNGFIPDGLFLRSAMLIIQELNKPNWEIRGCNSIRVQMPAKCEFIMECDALRGIISINAMFTEPYIPLNLLRFITEIFNTFTSVMCSQQLQTVIGPPCPLSCDECQQRGGVSWKTHVVDVNQYSQHNRLFCGRERIDEDNYVELWIQKKPSVLIAEVPDDTVKCLSLKTRIPDLPSKVIQIICDSMNGCDSLHHNWEGLANLLNYTNRQLWSLENNLNPTGALLHSYGQQMNATFDGILQLLRHRELERLDVIREIYENFEIVE